LFYYTLLKVYEIGSTKQLFGESDSKEGEVLKTFRLSYPFTTPVTEPINTKIVLTIGFFDGVHIGHQEVIRRALYMGRNENLPTAIMTFDPHPRVFLGQMQHPQFLTPLEDKLKLFAELGLDYAFVMNFNEPFSRVTAEKFVLEVLPALKTNTVVVGYNFTFGHLGRGTVEQLRELSDGLMRVNVVRPFHYEDEKVSSTLIREKLHLGDMSRVKKLMNRNYSVTGVVVQGKGLGRQLGFPTANLELKDPYVIPKFGVYAVEAEVFGTKYKGIMNIGIRPTFQDSNKPTLELFIFDFDRSIYGEEIKVHFISFIRDEMKFKSVELLVAQIQADVQTAKNRLLSSSDHL